MIYIIYLELYSYITVDVIEVLIKYCINLLPKIDQFNSLKIDQLPVCLNRPIDFRFSDWLTNWEQADTKQEVEQFSRNWIELNSR